MRKLCLNYLLSGGFLFFASNFIAQNTLPSNGNVGVGTITPSASLEVVGSTRLGGAVTVVDSVRIEKKLRVDQDVRILGKTVMLDNARAKSNFTVEGITNLQGTTRVHGNLRLLDLADSTATLSEILMIRPNGVVEKGGAFAVIDAAYAELPNCVGSLPKWSSYIDGAGEGVIYAGVTPCRGRVGIGIQNPTETFQVAGTAAISGNVSLGNNVGIGTQPQSYARTLIASNPGQIGVQLNMPNSTDYQIGFFASVTPTANNNAKLFVGHNATTNQDVFRVLSSGAVEAKSLRLSLNIWSDYVFEKDYPLMPLDSLQSYIDSNGHLPNIPTTVEVIKEGIDVGEINAKLLEKIEELTLYILMLKKELEVVKSEVEVLKLD